MANIINGTDTGSGGLITTGDSSDELQLQTAETARVTLTNTAVVVNEGGNDVDFRVEGDTDANLLFVDAGNDRVGIGTSSPGEKLVVSTATTNTTLQVTNTSSNFQVQSNSNDGYFNLNGSGDIIFRSGTPSVSERIRILASGGITFNGDTAAANALDDYEEGTFTPDVRASVSDPTVTYTSRYGFYTKIGRMVYISLRVQIATVAGGSGFLQLAGLPFVSDDTSNVQHNLGGTFSNNLNWGASATQLSPVVFGNTTIVSLRGLQNNGANSDLGITDLSNGDYVDAQGWYFV